MRKLIWLASLPIMVLAFNNCQYKGWNTSQPDSMGASGLSSSAEIPAGLAAFKSGFYSFANSQGCVKCHGVIVHPQFANADVNVAYAEAKGTRRGSAELLIDFGNPDSAQYIAYSANSHCGDVPCQNPANAATVKALVEAWAKAERPAGTPTAPPASGTALPKYLTSSLALPAMIPTINAAPKVVRFPLSQLKPAVAVLSNAIFEVEIQMVNADTYRVSRPKIAGNTASVKITGMHVFVRTSTQTGVGTEDLNQGNLWDLVAITAPVFTLPANLPTTPLGATPLDTRALNIQVQSTADVMTIGIDLIEQ